ncbi:MAG: hypothetical protein WC408_04465, partial [Candidatus Micrarchaeia archaeon]
FDKILTLGKFLNEPYDHEIKEKARAITKAELSDEESMQNAGMNIMYDVYMTKPKWENPEINRIVERAADAVELMRNHRQTQDPAHLRKLIEYFRDEKLYDQRTYKDIINKVNSEKYTDAVNAISNAYHAAYSRKYINPKEVEHIHDIAKSELMSDLVGYVTEYISQPDVHASRRMIEMHELGEKIARQINSNPELVERGKIIDKAAKDIEAVRPELRQKLGNNPIYLPGKVLYKDGLFYKLTMQENEPLSNARPIFPPKEYDVHSRAQLNEIVLARERKLHPNARNLHL